MIDIRAATQKDVEAFYGGKPLKSMRAFVAVLDGQPIGIGGIFREEHMHVVFSEMKPEMRKYKKAILKISYLVCDIMKQYNVVYAVASKNEESATRLITHFGFRLVEINSEGEGVYVWHN